MSAQTEIAVALHVVLQCELIGKLKFQKLKYIQTLRLLPRADLGLARQVHLERSLLRGRSWGHALASAQQ